MPSAKHHGGSDDGRHHARDSRGVYPNATVVQGHAQRHAQDRDRDRSGEDQDGQSPARLGQLPCGRRRLNMRFLI